MIQFIDCSRWITMSMQFFIQMWSWWNEKTTIEIVTRFDCSPCRYYSIGRSKWKVVQVLMRRMSTIWKSETFLFQIVNVMYQNLLLSVPESGGLAISILCTATMFWPVNASTISIIGLYSMYVRSTSSWVISWILFTDFRSETSRITVITSLPITPDAMSSKRWLQLFSMSNGTNFGKTMYPLVS